MTLFSSFRHTGILVTPPEWPPMGPKKKFFFANHWTSYGGCIIRFSARSDMWGVDTYLHLWKWPVSFITVFSHFQLWNSHFLAIFRARYLQGPSGDFFKNGQIRFLGVLGSDISQNFERGRQFDFPDLPTKRGSDGIKDVVTELEANFVRQVEM